MALATFEQSPFETLVDPAVGITFGYAWGASVGAFLEDHPLAELVTDEADIQEYALTTPFGFCGLEAYAFFQFQLDCLISISIRWGFEEQVPIDEDCAACIAQALMGWFSNEIEQLDDAFYQVEEGPTRASLDWMEQRMVLEEILE